MQLQVVPVTPFQQNGSVIGSHAHIDHAGVTGELALSGARERGA